MKNFPFKVFEPTSHNEDVRLFLYVLKCHFTTKGKIWKLHSHLALMHHTTLTNAQMEKVYFSKS